MSDFTSSAVGGRGSGAASELGDAGFTGGATQGRPLPENPDVPVAHRLPVDRSRSMKSITEEVETLLGTLEDGPRQSAALLASELIAQVVGRAPGWNSESVGLTIQLREDAVRMEATGPIAPPIEATPYYDVVHDDPLGDWGRFIIDRLADRWGFGGSERQAIWAEIATPA